MVKLRFPGWNEKSAPRGERPNRTSSPVLGSGRPHSEIS